MTFVLTGAFPATLGGRPVVPADPAVATPSVALDGAVREVGGNYVQSFTLGTLPGGYTWRIGPVGGTAATSDGVDVVMATVASGDRPNAVVYAVSAAGVPTTPVTLALSYPPAPVIEYTGSLTLTSTWVEGTSITTAVPTVTTSGVTTVLTYQTHSVGTGGTPLTSSSTPITTVPAAGIYTSLIWTASKAGYADVTIVTSRYIALVDDSDLTLAEVFTPQLAEIQDAMNAILDEHQNNGATVDGNNEGQDVKKQFLKTPYLLMACEEFSGQTRTHTGATFTTARTGGTRLLDWLKYLTNANNRLPAGRSAYQGQHEQRFICPVAIGRDTPGIWDLSQPSGGLSAVQKNRIDLAMKSCGAASAWVVSAVNPYITGALAGEERTNRGFKAQNGGVPNYSLPPRLIPFIVDAYLRRSGSSLQAFLTSFDPPAFAAECTAAGNIANTAETWAQQWTADYLIAKYGGAAPLTWAPGPTAAQLVAALSTDHAGGIYRAVGEGGPFTLDEGHTAFVAEINRFFSKTVQPGPSAYLLAGVDTPLPGRETGDAPWDTGGYGLKPVSGIAANVGILRGCLTKSAWAGLPNPGELGMMAELSARDGGGGGNPPVRSELVYTTQGAMALAGLLTAGIILGVVNPDAPDYVALVPQMTVGVVDYFYRINHTHLGYSKGNQNQPNRDANRAFFDGDNGHVLTHYAAWRMILLRSGVDLPAEITLL